MSVGITSVERRGERLLMAVVALAAIAGVGLQLFLALTRADSVGIASTTVRLLSYFTILSNLMVALAAGHAAAGGAPTSFLGRPSARGAVVVFIVVTGVVYAVLIAPHVRLEGAYVWSNALLHDVVPILYPLAWIIYGGHGALRWSDAVWWLTVPLVYMVWTLVRGQATGEYPYAFVDVATLGMPAVLVNALGLLAGFLLLGLVVVGIDRILARRRG